MILSMNDSVLDTTTGWVIWEIETVVSMPAVPPPPRASATSLGFLGIPGIIGLWPDDGPSMERIGRRHLGPPPANGPTESYRVFDVVFLLSLLLLLPSFVSGRSGDRKCVSHRPFYGFYWVSYRVFFYGAEEGVEKTSNELVDLGFTGFSLVSKGFTRYEPGLNGFYRVLPGFTWFQRV